MIYGGLFDFEKTQKRIDELEQIMDEPNFWSNKRQSESIISEHTTLTNLLKEVKELKEKFDKYEANA